MNQQSNSSDSTESAPEVPPAELELADGTRLVLDSAPEPVRHCRVDGASGADALSLDDVMQLSGQPFAGYRVLSAEHGSARALGR